MPIHHHSQPQQEFQEANPVGQQRGERRKRDHRHHDQKPSGFHLHEPIQILGNRHQKGEVDHGAISTTF